MGLVEEGVVWWRMKGWMGIGVEDSGVVGVRREGSVGCGVM